MNTKVFAEKVLLVDDDESILDLLCQAMISEGIAFVTARQGHEGLQRLQDNKIFLILSDYKMPDMDGLEFCKHVRKVDDKLPFVIQSGLADRNALVEGLRTGVSDFLDKPLDLAKLIELIKGYKNKRLDQIKQEDFEIQTIKNIFLEEAKGILENLDESILHIESDANDKEEINKVFRKVHTLKGSAASIPGGQSTSELAHSFENVLTAIKDGQVELSKNLVDLMLSSVDVLKECIVSIETQGPSPDISLFTAQFKKALATPSSQHHQLGHKIPSPSRNEKREEHDEGVTVSNEKLDHFMELAGELVAFKNIFYGFIKQRIDSLSLDDELQDMNKSLAKLTEDLQSQIMEIRKISLQKAFAKFPRMVRQIAQDLHKAVAYETSGLELQVDKIIAKNLASSLVHVVRNACDHGIETMETRRAKGKPEAGRIVITASQTADIVTLRIQDDGAGLDRQRIYSKALSKGLVTKDIDQMSDAEIYDLLFLPGFSTAEAVSDLSGRGVGMDVVKTAVTSLGGQVRFESILGQSTCLILTIPVPKSIMVEQSIVASYNQLLIAIPLSCISEIKPVSGMDFTYIPPFWMIEHNGKTIPIVSYEQLVHPHEINKQQLDIKAHELVVVIMHKDNYVALRIDAIKSQLEAVVRPFDRITQTIPGFKGTSQLPGDELAFMVSSEDFLRLVSTQNHLHALAPAA